MSMKDVIDKAKKNWKIVVPACSAFALWIAFTVYTFVRFGFCLAPLLFLVFALLRIKPLRFEREFLNDVYLGGLTAIFTFYTCQMIISYGCVALRRLLHWSMLAFIWEKTGSEVITYSLCIFATIYVFLRLCRVNPKVAAIVIPIPFLLFSIADVFVVAARGYELIAVDLVNISTARTVAGNYHFDLVHVFFYAVIPYALYVLAITNLNIKDRKVKGKKDALHCAGALAVMALLTFLTYMPYSLEHVIRTYNYGPSYANTFVLNLIHSVDLFRVKKPVDYSISYINEEAAKIEQQASPDTEAWLDDDVNIIVIMNEAYADMSLYERYYDSYTDPTPFFHELAQDENAISGYYLASIFGSNTANSEFEFLTGLSLGYINDGLVPFTTSITRNMDALPRYLATQGYTSIAMHPNVAENWRRNTVYPFMGFDKMVFIRDMNLTSADYIRNNASDQAAYREMIDEINAQHQAGNDRVFTFLITMQNHGGFADGHDYSNFTPDTYVTSSKTTLINFDELNTYQSLVHESDLALEYLVNWMEEQDEKYVLFIFGDHQPSVTGIFNSASYTLQSYEVPFLLWANYDIPEDVRTSIEDQFIHVDGMQANVSMNYCALDVMRYAGLPLSPFYQTLSSIRQSVPVINGDWYYDLSKKEFQLLPHMEEVQPNDALKLYAFLQYDVLFDKNNSDITEY